MSIADNLLSLYGESEVRDSFKQDQKFVASDDTDAMQAIIDIKDGNMVVEYRQDIGSVLDENAKLRADGNGISKSGDLKRIASVPMVVLKMWEKEGFYYNSPKKSGMSHQEHQKELRRRFNDPDNSMFRTSYGRV